MGSSSLGSDLDLYIKRIKDYPLLTAEQEVELAKKYKQGDVDAGDKIITCNLRFVVKISKGYFHLGYRPLEIIQEGNMGLIKALTRFDPDRGVRFICYAIWWIRAYIQSFIHKTYQPHIGRLTHARSLFSLDSGLNREGSEDSTLMDYVIDSKPSQEDLCVMKERAFHLNNILTSCPSLLSEREMFIIRERFLNEPSSTLKDIAIKIGVTRERVRQIESRSLRRIRSALEGSYSIFAEDFVPSYDYPTKGIRQ